MLEKTQSVRLRRGKECRGFQERRKHIPSLGRKKGEISVDAGAPQHVNFASTLAAGREVPLDETKTGGTRACLRSGALKAILSSAPLPLSPPCCASGRGPRTPSSAAPRLGRPRAHRFCLSTQALEEGGWASGAPGLAGWRAGPTWEAPLCWEGLASGTERRSVRAQGSRTR